MGAALLVFGASPAAAQRPVETVDPSILDGSAQRALDEARARWDREGMSSYRYMVGITCLFACDRSTWAVSVRHGKRLATGHLSSVPRLFEQIQDAIDDRYKRLSVNYGERGVPRSIATEVSENMQDDFSTVRVWGFRRYRVDPSIRDGSARRALDAARARWRAHGLRSYSFRLTRPPCQGSVCLPRRWTYVVRNGKTRSGPPEWSTVPRLFATIEQAIESRVESLGVRYDANGMPRSIAIRELDHRDAEIPLAAGRLRPVACASAQARAAC